MAGQFNPCAIILDMDGVIIDSEPLHLLSWQEVLRSYAIAYSADEHKHFLGRKDLFIAGELSAKYGLGIPAIDLMKQKESRYLQILKEDATEQPGVQAFLEEAKATGIPCALASSATSATIATTLSVLSLAEYFKVVVSGDEVEQGKPAPDIFLLAAEKLQVTPEKCLVVEDSYNGILAARRAGMFCIAIPCDQTRHQDHSQAHLQLNSMEEILPLSSLSLTIIS